MRLLHYNNNGKLSLTDFSESARPKYAILSHRWEMEEFTFDDLRQDTGWEKAGYEKVRRCGLQARNDGLEHFWVDTCCIDKSSSSELSEAINSMFEWYKQSAFCYVYLSDVNAESFSEDFRASRWFTRGWTLQELIAPETVRFFDVDWNESGSRTSLCEVIAKITSISEKVLRYPSTLPSCSVAQRMSWAAGRKTTRPEDLAYSLLGIFRIHMPLLYGERTKAFMRLQEEILKTSVDDSILAWGLDTQPPSTKDLYEDVYIELRGRGWDSRGLLANSPEDFKNCGMIRYNVNPSSAYSMSNLGLDIQLPCLSANYRRASSDEPPRRGEEGLNKYEGGIGLLRCTSNNGTEFLGILLSSLQNGYRCDRILLRSTSEHATVLVNARVASRAVMQSITINHGRDWGIEQISTSGRIMHIIPENSPGFPVQILEVSSYSLKSPWTKNKHIWDPASQVITAQLANTSDEADDLFIIEYQAGTPRWSQYAIDATRIFVVIWWGQALVRKTAPFSPSDYDELKKRTRHPWDRASMIGGFSTAKYKVNAESVAVTARSHGEQKNLSLDVGVKETNVLNTCLFTLNLALKGWVPPEYSGKTGT